MVGQQTIIWFSDPLGRGWKLFGTAELGPNAGIYNHPTAIAIIQLSAILGGHILGIVAAHERSLVLLHGPNQTPRSTVLGQLPMSLVMVFFTCAGPLLLFSP